MDGIEAHAPILVVPDYVHYVQDTEVMIGQPFTERPSVHVVKTPDVLTMLQVDNLDQIQIETMIKKVPVVTMKRVDIPSNLHAMIEVSVPELCQGIINISLV